MKDNRDPLLLAKVIFGSRDQTSDLTLSQHVDRLGWRLKDVPDYRHDEGPLERYGDPRALHKEAT